MQTASPSRGRFIVVDGIDGGGKSTQIEAIQENLRQRGRRVQPFRDPGSTPIGEQLRSILLGSDVKIHRRTEALIFMAARSEMVAELLEPTLADGIDVVCDRYLISTVVYQSVGGGVSPEDLWQVGRWASGGLEPDLTILLDLPAEVSIERVGGDRDRMESRGLAYLEDVRQAYLDQLHHCGGKQVVIDANDCLGDVTQAVRLSVVANLG